MITLRPVPASDDGSGADPDPPADPLWPLGDEVATALVGLLEVELRGRGLRWRVLARDCLEVGRTDAPWPGAVIDLTPLRERMYDRAKADWPELVEQYVSELRTEPAAADTTTHPADAPQPLGAPASIRATAPRSPTAPHAIPLDQLPLEHIPLHPASPKTTSLTPADVSLWQQAREPLRARILPADASLPGALQRPVADGLVETVMTERGSQPLPGGEPISAADALEWGVAEHVVFDAARANARAIAPLEAESFTIDGTGLVALFGPSHYTATHVLWLAEHLAEIPGYTAANGALVVLPHRHLIAVHPIESAAVVAAAGTLLRFAARQFETCPGPISDQLYWWHDGALHRLPSDSVGETLHLFPSDRFAALLDRLRRGDGFGH